MALDSEVASSLILGASGIGSGILSGISSARSAKRAYNYALKLQQHQYNLNMQSLRESPMNARIGYTSAGYNPLLALDSGMSGVTPSATMSPTENNLASDVNNGLNSAVAYMQSKAQVDNINANSALATEQAETERAKRVQMEFQNAMTDVQTHLARKDLSTYDRRFYANLYEQMQRAENYKANSAVSQMNANTNRINSVTNQQNSAINAIYADKERRYAEWARKHPYLSSFDETIQRYRGINYSQRSGNSSTSFGI